MEIDPFTAPPLYEYDQIVTGTDLDDVMRSILKVHDSTPVKRRRDRDRLRWMIEGVYSVREWLDRGKPRG